MKLISRNELKLSRFNQLIESAEILLQYLVYTLHQLASSQRRHKELQEEYNQLLHKYQQLGLRARLWREENDHLYYLLIAEKE